MYCKQNLNPLLRMARSGKMMYERRRKRYRSTNAARQTLRAGSLTTSNGTSCAIGIRSERQTAIRETLNLHPHGCLTASQTSTQMRWTTTRSLLCYRAREAMSRMQRCCPPSSRSYWSRMDLSKYTLMHGGTSSKLAHAFMACFGIPAKTMVLAISMCAALTS